MHWRIRKLRTIAFFGGVWFSGFALQWGLLPMRERMLRPRITGAVPSFTEEEVDRYVRETGGDPDLYRNADGHLLTPPTFFAIWALAELAKALIAARLPLDFTRAVHATSRVQIHHLPKATEPARFAATVETVVRTGNRIRIEQRLAMTTADGQPLVDHWSALVLPGRGRLRAKRQTVPLDTSLVAAIRLASNEGWKYARLSGDINPVHWAGPFARLVGFGGPVAHGFDTMARIFHAAVAHFAGGDAQKVKTLDVSFRRPIVLPAEMHLFASGVETTVSGDKQISLWVGSEQESTAYVTGHVELEG